MDRFTIVENPCYRRLYRQMRWYVVDNYSGVVHAKMHSFTDAVTFVCALVGYVVVAQ